VEKQDNLLPMLEEALPVIARIASGQAAIIDSGGFCLKALDSGGQNIEPESGILEIALAAAQSGKPESGFSRDVEGAEIWALPLGQYVLVTCNTDIHVHNRKVTDSLREVLPVIGQVVGGEAVLFDREGRRLYSVDHLGNPNKSFVGRVSLAAKKVMDTGKPLAGESTTVEGATAIRIPITPWLGLGMNNEQSTHYQRKLLSEVRKFQSAKYRFDDIIGSSLCMRSTIQMISSVANSSSTVLLIGETGTGKELFAQSIHNESNRRSQPFIAINCSAIPETLIESYLFGYVEGSFTGAKKTGAVGAFEQANGGTLFLDELGEMGMELQKKLLRVIQERVVSRLGSLKTIPLDIRIIASTNRDLRALIRANQFREDLYFRFSVMEFVLPSLRERKEDIPELIQFFIKKYNLIMGRQIKRADEEFYRLCHLYDWPGNVRELQNYVEYTINLARPDEEILRWELLPPKLKIQQPDPAIDASRSPQAAAPNGKEEIYPNVLDAAERNTILEALKRCNGDKKACARILEISGTTLWRKMKRLGIEAERVWY
jgi:transcriptional regulator with PAS, ATPase and Fis domain